MVSATHLVTIDAYIVKPGFIRKEDKAGIRSWVITLLKERAPELDIENVKIEEA